ncbi:MAG TPA: gamma-glutamylcyclotransferase family protein [bacterium]|nr:gamma-glutamylcyclotransferase family protein [bacterium]
MAAPAGPGGLAVSRLFVYGTLKDDAVVQGLLGHHVFGRPAILQGYERAFDPAIGYPVIRACPGTHVAGKLLDGIDAEALRILDAYEGDHYRRIVVSVHTIEGRALDAHVYVPA